jgi:hypothetical protein
MLSVNFFCNISSYDILAYITKNYIALIYYAKIVHLLCQFHAGKVGYSAVARPEGECIMSSTLTTIWHSHCYHNIIIIIMLTVICRQHILRTITIKEVVILVTNILDQIVLKVWEYSSQHYYIIIMLSVNFFCNISSYDILAYITKNYIALIYYAKIVHLLCQFHAKEVLILVTNILDHIVLKVWEYSLLHLRL